MTYGDFIRKNIMSSEAMGMVAKINASPLTFNEKREFQAKEFNDITDFSKDLADFILSR